MVAVCVIVIARGFRWIEGVDDAPTPPPPSGSTDDAGRSRDATVTFAAVSAAAARIVARLSRDEAGDGAERDVSMSAAEPGEPTEPADSTASGDPGAATQPSNRDRLIGLVPVAAACLFNLIVLRPETTPASTLNDS
ncbi:MAG: hypothetical protein ACKOOG_08365, partial [Actinomycetota bacterium]